MRGLGCQSPESSFQGLDSLGEEIDQLGWSLGVAWANEGADVLMNRNRGDGSSLLVSYIRELRGKPPLDSNLPLLTSSCPVTLPYAIAQLVWWGSAHAEQPRFECEQGRWHIRGTWEPGDQIPPPDGFLQDSHLTLCSNGIWHLEVPATWMHSK